MKKALVIIGIIILIFVIWFLVNTNFLRPIKQITPINTFEDQAQIPDHMRVCQTDDDCTEAETLCSSCCGYQGINKDFEEEYYKNVYDNTCRGYVGGVCECYNPVVPVCVSGLCDVKSFGSDKITF